MKGSLGIVHKCFAPHSTLVFPFNRLSEACYEACEIATADFANNPVASACICFLYLLGMDTLALKVEVESANFVLKHWEKRDDELYSADEKLKKFIGILI